MNSSDIKKAVLDLVDYHIQKVYDQVKRNGGQGNPLTALADLEDKLRLLFQSMENN